MTELAETSDHYDATSNKEQRDEVIALLKQEGADDIEISLFGCWADGIVKSAQIAEQLELDISEIYKATKRIERRLPKIHSQLTF